MAQTLYGVPLEYYGLGKTQSLSPINIIQPTGEIRHEPGVGYTYIGTDRYYATPELAYAAQQYTKGNRGAEEQFRTELQAGKAPTYSEAGKAKSAQVQYDIALTEQQKQQALEAYGAPGSVREYQRLSGQSQVEVSRSLFEKGGVAVPKTPILTGVEGVSLIFEPAPAPRTSLPMVPQREGELGIVRPGEQIFLPGRKIVGYEDRTVEFRYLPAGFYAQFGIQKPDLSYLLTTPEAQKLTEQKQLEIANIGAPLPISFLTDYSQISSGSLKLGQQASEWLRSGRLPPEMRQYVPEYVRTGYKVLEEGVAGGAVLVSTIPAVLETGSKIISEPKTIIPFFRAAPGYFVGQMLPSFLENPIRFAAVTMIQGGILGGVIKATPSIISRYPTTIRGQSFQAVKEMISPPEKIGLYNVRAIRYAGYSSAGISSEFYRSGAGTRINIDEPYGLYRKDIPFEVKTSFYTIPKRGGAGIISQARPDIPRKESETEVKTSSGQSLIVKQIEETKQEQILKPAVQTLFLEAKRVPKTDLTGYISEYTRTSEMLDVSKAASTSRFKRAIIPTQETIIETIFKTPPEQRTDMGLREGLVTQIKPAISERLAPSTAIAPSLKESVTPSQLSKVDTSITQEVSPLLRTDLVTATELRQKQITDTIQTQKTVLSSIDTLREIYKKPQPKRTILLQPSDKDIILRRKKREVKGGYSVYGEHAKVSTSLQVLGFGRGKGKSPISKSSKFKVSKSLTKSKLKRR